MKIDQPTPSRFFLFGILCAASLAVVQNSAADVTFVSSDSAGIAVVAGSSFTLDLSLDITGGEEVTGISYELTQESGPSSGVMSITGVTDRDDGLLESDFSFVNSTDSQVTASPGNALNPTNALDLGAGLQDPTMPVSNGIYLLGVYTISVSSSAATGTYDISPTFLAPYTNGDWIGNESANFPDDDISSRLVIPVDVVGAVVVPEPSTWALAALGLAGMVFAIRRRNATR